ncbi:hypothetical protein [Marimonas arenosa]|uniref:Uncharacterized protein n=1 Tax=Marimonas arenosa TaxID=1795305 RepID=A0AAE4B2Y0_9RHOB|nr:hypothetical protein [Marimonas arenosa]MDQ2088732.1 hypothetical protein [Marimonas arenosa]
MTFIDNNQDVCWRVSAGSLLQKCTSQAHATRQLVQSPAFFFSGATSSAVRFQVRAIDHQRGRLAALIRKFEQHPGENALVAPAPD